MRRPRPVLKAVLTVAAATVLAAVVFVYAMFDPSDSLYWPKCPFHLLTGLECPGCGSQRALHCLLTGDLAGALHYNFLVTLAIPYILLYFLLLCVSRFPAKASLRRTASGIRLAMYHGTAVRIVLVLVLVFWIARNFTPLF